MEEIEKEADWVDLFLADVETPDAVPDSTESQDIFHQDTMKRVWPVLKEKVGTEREPILLGMARNMKANSFLVFWSDGGEHVRCGHMTTKKFTKGLWHITVSCAQYKRPKIKCGAKLFLTGSAAIDFAKTETVLDVSNWTVKLNAKCKPHNNLK